MKGSADHKGYLTVNLYQKTVEVGKYVCKNYKVHRLVAIAFIPNPENKAQINHINGLKSDNRVENLEWCTNYENRQHAIKTGLAWHCKKS